MGEIGRLRDDLINERDRTLRTLADFKNYRRRIERDAAKVSEDGKRTIILPLLGIVDDLENALSYAPDTDASFVQGIRNIRLKILALLDASGVRPFDCTGSMFDHEMHEAVSMAEYKDRAVGTVVDELRRGYLWDDQLLRPAQVRVAG